MIHTCIGCENYCPRDYKFTGWNEVIPGVLEPVHEEVPAHCKEHEDVRQKWMEKYGDLPTNQLTKDMELPCFVLPKHMVLLENCINTAEQILDKLNKKEKTE